VAAHFHGSAGSLTIDEPRAYSRETLAEIGPDFGGGMATKLGDLIAAARSADLAAVRRLIDADADVNEQDEHGWTALSWAAGAGQRELAALLLASGADVFHSGKDERTPYQIAIAANRRAVADVLREAEEKSGGDARRVSSRMHELRPYCRAYPLTAFQAYSRWQPTVPEPDLGETPAQPEDVVFLHRDLTVTRSIWQSDGVVFTDPTAEWREFCERVLNFRPPDDFDWLPSAQSS
jgi:hypothetical protein